MKGPTRRRLVGLLATVAAAFGQAQAQPAAVASVTVDVGPLLAKGLGPYAENVRATVAAAARSAFADRMAPAGGRLVVRIDAVSLRDYAGGGGGGRIFGTESASDYMQGEALLLDRRGGVLWRQPQLSALPASAGGAWYLPDNEQRRLAALAEHFAGWLRRRFG